MISWKKPGGICLTLLVILGGTGWWFMRSGLFPINADAVPPDLEKRLASTAVDAWVDRHVEARPNLLASTPEKTSRGKKLYQQNCLLCHGSVSSPLKPGDLAGTMYPPPPQFSSRIPHDPLDNLFLITRRGIRLTGMPAFGKILSDEEIEQIVLYLDQQRKASRP